MAEWISPARWLLLILLPMIPVAWYLMYRAMKDTYKCAFGVDRIAIEMENYNANRKARRRLP